MLPLKGLSSLLFLIFVQSYFVLAQQEGRSSADPYKSNIERALTLQESGDFTLSNQTLNRTLSEELSLLQEVTVFRLISRNLIGLGQLDSAKLVLENIIDRDLDPTNKELRYQLALSYRLLRFYYQRQGDYQTVLECLYKALAIFDNDTSNVIILRKTYHDIGVGYSRDFMPEDALPWFKKSLEMAANSNDIEVEKDRRASILALASIYSDKREMDKAIGQFKLVLNMIEGQEKDLVRDYMVACGNLGIAFDEMGELDSALVYYKKAYNNLDNMENSSFKAIVPRFRSKLLSDIGVVYRKKTDQVEALAYLKRGLRLGIDFFGEIHPLVGEFRYQLGLAEMEFELYDDAERNLLLVMETYKETENEMGYRMAQGFNALGQLYGKRQLIEQSLNYYDSGLLSNPQVMLDGKKLYGSITAALRTFEGKLEIFDQIESDSLKLSILTEIKRDLIAQSHYSIVNNHDAAVIDEIQHIFQMMVAAYFEIDARSGSDHLEVIWDLVEANKSRRLNAQIKHSEALQNSIPQQVLETEQSLRDEIVSAMNEPKGLRKDSLILAVNLRYDSLIEVFENDFVEYFELKYQYRTPDFDDLRESALQDNQLMISYFLTPQFIYIISIDSEGSDLHRIDRDEHFDKHFETFIQSINDPSSFQSVELNYKSFVESSHYLFQQLIGPVRTNREGKQLVIVPDDKLFFIPFEVLIDDYKEIAEGEFRSLPYLLKDHVISYSTSGTSLFNFNKEMHYEVGTKVMAMAPSFGESADGETTRSGLENLEWTGDEIHSIASYFETEIFVDETATERVFIEKAKEFSMLHIASHGIVEDAEPLASKIAFAIDKKDSLYDGYLHSYELYGAQLNAELAVLSACNTGYGKLAKGEGILSLARDFFQSGCQSVVMTLWLANDYTTAKLMDNFYHRLSLGNRKDEALRAAKLRFLEEADYVQSHPFYWAAFVASGDMRPIVSKQGFRWYYALLILGLIGVYAVYRRK